MLAGERARKALETWLLGLSKQLSFGGQCGPLVLKALDGDAGFRRYFRLRARDVNLIAVYSPPETEKNQAFLDIDTFLLAQGVHTPNIVAHDIDSGFFLLEDLGETMYFEHLDTDNAHLLYGEALFSLLRIQQSPKDFSIFPMYDAQSLDAELALFTDWFVPRLLDYSPDAEENVILSKTFTLLIESALQQPQVIVHRDFHCRNIVFGEGGSPGIIDFQDAVIGPVTYDLVSLLRDCYIEWPQKQVNQWAIAYANMAIDVGIMPVVSEEQFLRWFDFMGLQRHLKVLGIFSRLSLRDGKHRYLSDLPRVIHYVQSVATKHRETRALAEWFEDALMPLINNKSWYRSS